MNGIPRNNTADLMKGIAVILMIQVHSIELFATPEIFNSTAGKFLLWLGGPPVAPVFAVVMGYFVAASTRTTKQLLVRGIKLFALGMLLNIGLNLNLIIHVAQGKLEIDLFPYLFGVDILQFAGLSLIVMSVFKKLCSRYWYISFVMAFICAAIPDMVSGVIPRENISTYIISFFYGISSWSYFPLFPWLAYPLVGMGFYYLQKQFALSNFLNPMRKIAIIVLFSVFLFLTRNYSSGITSNLGSYYHHGILFFLWSLVFLLFYSFMIYISKKYFETSSLGKYLKWLGKNVTMLYLIQWLIVGNTATVIYKTISSGGMLLAYIIGIIVISSIIVFVLTRNRNKDQIKAF